MVCSVCGGDDRNKITSVPAPVSTSCSLLHFTHRYHPPLMQRAVCPRMQVVSFLAFFLLSKVYTCVYVSYTVSFPQRKTAPFRGKYLYVLVPMKQWCSIAELKLLDRDKIFVVYNVLVFTYVIPELYGESSRPVVKYVCFC